MNKIAAEAAEEYLAKNASNTSGGTFSGDVLGCGNGLVQYPSYTTTSKKVVRTTTTVREYNEQGNLVKETETVVEEETNPSYTTPYQPYTVTF